MLLLNNTDFASNVLTLLCHVLPDVLHANLALLLQGADDNGSESLWSSVQQHPAPAAPKDAKLLFTVTMPGTPRDFFNVVLADDSHFLEDFWQEQGNK